MAPDRGASSPESSLSAAVDRSDNMNEEPAVEDTDGADDSENAALLPGSHTRSEAQAFLAEQASQGQNFTLRGVLVGLAIGVVICFSNTYFGLQTGWVSGMAMPAALIGFAYFKAIARWIDYPFTPVENVLVQTVAGAVGTMPLGCGFVGVMPALNYLMSSEENGPLLLSTWKLIIWALGLCFFGVVIAVPLRREFIIREKLKFPSGTATALMIGVLHGKTQDAALTKAESGTKDLKRQSRDLTPSSSNSSRVPPQNGGLQQIPPSFGADFDSADNGDHRGDWKAKIMQLLYAFAVSAVYVCFSNLECLLYGHANLHRHSFHISSLRFATFQYLGCLLPNNGSGR